MFSFGSKNTEINKKYNRKSIIFFLYYKMFLSETPKRSNSDKVYHAV